MGRGKSKWAKAEAETTERARAWAKEKAREKTEIARISDEAREKVEPEAEVTERSRAKEKSIAPKRVAAEDGAETRVRVEAKDDIRDQDVGILTDLLNKVKAESKRLKRTMFGAEEKTKDKAKSSRAEVETEERAVK